MIICCLEGSHEKIRKRIYYLKNIELCKSRNSIRYQQNKEKWNEYMKGYNKKLRIKIRSIILWYFNYTCAKCGYHDDPRALQLDHKDGGGNKEQKTIGPIAAYYYDKLAILFEKFQLLCANCNYIKRHENNEW